MQILGHGRVPLQGAIGVSALTLGHAWARFLVRREGFFGLWGLAPSGLRLFL